MFLDQALASAKAGSMTGSAQIAQKPTGTSSTAAKPSGSTSSSSAAAFLASMQPMTTLIASHSKNAEPTAAAAAGSGAGFGAVTLKADPFAQFGGPVSTGTSIMAVSFDGGVVIAADSRTSTGEYVSNRVSDKLTKVHDRIYCARSGSAADTQAIADIVSYYLDVHAIELDSDPKVHTAASLFQDIVYQNKDRLLAGIIVAGWDKKSGGQVYSITLGGTMVRGPYAIGGSGSTYIYGLCDTEFRLGMSKAECQTFVLKALSHAMARDGSSGGVIRMATIDAGGVERSFTAGDKLPYMPELMF